MLLVGKEHRTPWITWRSRYSCKSMFNDTQHTRAYVNSAMRETLKWQLSHRLLRYEQQLDLNSRSSQILFTVC